MSARTEILEQSLANRAFSWTHNQNSERASCGMPPSDDATTIQVHTSLLGQLLRQLILGPDICVPRVRDCAIESGDCRREPVVRRNHRSKSKLKKLLDVMGLDHASVANNEIATMIVDSCIAR